MRYCTKHEKEISADLMICAFCCDELSPEDSGLFASSERPNPLRMKLKAEGIEIEVDSIPVENFDMTMGEGKIGGKTAAERKIELKPGYVPSQMFCSPNDFAKLSGRSLGFGLNRAMPSAELPAIQDTLQERGNRYGKFSGHAKITQDIKSAMAQSKNWNAISPSQTEALEMIAHKIGRILNGDPNYADSWHDIAGYATLVDKQLQGIDQ